MPPVTGTLPYDKDILRLLDPSDPLFAFAGLSSESFGQPGDDQFGLLVGQVGKLSFFQPEKRGWFSVKHPARLLWSTPWADIQNAYVDSYVLGAHGAVSTYYTFAVSTSQRTVRFRTFQDRDEADTWVNFIQARMSKNPS